MVHLEAVLRCWEPGFSVRSIAARRKNNPIPLFKRGTALPSHPRRAQRGYGTYDGRRDIWRCSLEGSIQEPPTESSGDGSTAR